MLTSAAKLNGSCNCYVYMAAQLPLQPAPLNFLRLRELSFIH